VAFVDVVNSTGWALELGDRGWSELLARHVELASQDLGDENGQLIFQKGDEIVAAFDGPGRAIRWASAVRRNALSLGLEVRAGVHAGEVESHAGQLSGLALHIGQRVSAAAAPGEILVTSTVEELVAGSGIPLVDGGVRDLKGLDRPWRVFSVAKS
jgi:class 3 adenylate cyclase